MACMSLKVVWVLIFGSTEFSKKYICYAKCSEEFKSGKKIGGNYARKKDMDKLRKETL